jgi:hypothetical protein
MCLLTLSWSGWLDLPRQWGMIPGMSLSKFTFTELVVAALLAFSIGFAVGWFSYQAG